MSKKVDSLTHRGADRKNIPTAEYRAVMADDERRPIQVAIARRNQDLDPQLVWRGKDLLDQEDLIVEAPPLYIQEKVHPKILIDDLVRHTKNPEAPGATMDLFADFNGLPDGTAKTDFYQHDANWSNRMILGDSLHVMASLAEREDLRGKVQCIYFDPPYGIRFNSNFQWSTTSHDVTDGNRKHITREPEQVKAFRDTWRDGVHSYLAYIRDRLTVARDLLSDSGSIFVQIGDENVHRVRALMDEVFGEENFVSLISYAKTTGFSSRHLASVCDYLIWYGRSKADIKCHTLLKKKVMGGPGASKYRPASSFGALSCSVIEPRKRPVRLDQLTSQGASKANDPFPFRGRQWLPPKGLHWKTKVTGLRRLAKSERVVQEGNSLAYVRFLDDFSAFHRTNVWLDVGGVQSRTDPKVYVVQTATQAVQRCILMTTDPGDLVLDPTCGSGTAAYVAEQWGRRWITIDTSRVALTLARARIMGARFPSYLLADSSEGQRKEAEISRKAPSEQPTFGCIRQGFVYKRVPHITLKQIAHNREIDLIWDKYEKELDPLWERLTALLGTQRQEWEIPRDPEESWQPQVRELHSKWWNLRIARQKEIDASIAANAPFDYLYDQPYQDKAVVRVAGPFTVESSSPHRVLGVGEDDELIDGTAERRHLEYGETRDFARMVLDHLRTAGVQHAHRTGRIKFTSITGWPGIYVCATGEYLEGDRVRRAGILIGPEFGTVSRPDLAAAAREAGEAGFNALIACAFNFDAQSADFARLGQVPILRARMNADLHMADDLKNTGKGNLFVVFGEPDIRIRDKGDAQIQVEIKGVDVFDAGTGEIRSDDADSIACWFIDTDYNEESFFVRHAYFPSARDPYRALKKTLKAEIDRNAWATLRSNISRPFSKPESGRIAIKVINHLGDEAMKVFRV